MLKNKNKRYWYNILYMHMQCAQECNRMQVYPDAPAAVDFTPKSLRRPDEVGCATAVGLLVHI